MKRIWTTSLLAAAVCLGLLAPSAASAANLPGWTVSSLAVPTNFAPGGEGTYEVRTTNVGASPSDGSSIVIADSLPSGLTVQGVQLPLPGPLGGNDVAPTACEVQGPPGAQAVTCAVSATVQPNEALVLAIEVAVSATASGRLANSVSVQGGGAAAAAAEGSNEASPDPARAGFSSFIALATGPDGQAEGQAASHPFAYTTSFALNTAPGPTANPPIVPAEGDLKDVEVRLPPGLIGNPNSVPRCSARDFNAEAEEGAAHPENACPDASAVGFVAIQQMEGVAVRGTAQPLYNLIPPEGMPAQFGFQVGPLPFFIDTSVRTGSDYGISAQLRNTSQFKRITAGSVTIWGVPADPRHDALRGHCLNNGSLDSPISVGSCPAEEEPKPLLRLPTSCADPLTAEMIFNRWNAREDFLSERSTTPAPGGCDRVSFGSTLQVRPTSDAADSPTGLQAHLHVPQQEGFGELGTADLRRTVVALPEGLSINPAGANGLGACAPPEIGLLSPAGASPPRFTPAAARCPDDAKIGTVEVETPLLDHPLDGAVYVAEPYENPFASLLAIYLAVKDPETGVVLKLPGQVQADPGTGQLTTIFDRTPQLPFEDFTLDFFGGAAGVLRTPPTCGPYSIASTMTPYSAPQSGPPAASVERYEVLRSPAGGCPTSAADLLHAPTFDAGTVTPVAGAFSPFVLRLRREDGSQELSTVTLSPPPGLLARLAGVPYCSEAALSAAASRSGQEEKRMPACPAASQVGTVVVGAGAGPAPYYVQGRVYLAGPYKGAPLSLAIVTPATAGPYDLGTVVVRTALRVDPETARITAVSDPIPRLLQGIPLDVRTVTVRLDRPAFTLNPTNCDPLAVGAAVGSAFGRSASLSSPFQVGGCAALPFRPRLSLRLKGKTRRTGNPALRATLQMPGSGANIARASVALPHSEFLDQAHIRTICTRVQYAAGSGGGAGCPPGSVYGFARASSPLLDQPLRGPVFLRASSHQLPDLVASLDGQIHIDLVGRIDSLHGGIRTTFDSVPDAPVSKFTLSMQGGRKGLIENSTNVCRSRHRATTDFTGQNGVRRISRARLVFSCKGRRHRRHRGHYHGKHRRHGKHGHRGGRGAK